MTVDNESRPVADTIQYSELSQTRPSALTPSRGKGGDRRRRNRLGVLMVALVAGIGVAAGAARALSVPAIVLPVSLEPVVVYTPLRLEGALVRGVESNWAASRLTPPRYGDPVPIALTAYCLKGLTRRDNYVREGIVAADPRVFPLGRYVEVHVGRKYLGRFLVDDTGGVIKGNILDVWTPTCREARIFGRQKGTAVLVPRSGSAGGDAQMTGRLAGAVL